jgi:hypothetical protein
MIDVCGLLFGDGVNASLLGCDGFHVIMDEKDNAIDTRDFSGTAWPAGSVNAAAGSDSGRARGPK